MPLPTPASQHLQHLERPSAVPARCAARAALPGRLTRFRREQTAHCPASRRCLRCLCVNVPLPRLLPRLHLPGLMRSIVPCVRTVPAPPCAHATAAAPPAFPALDACSQAAVPGQAAPHAGAARQQRRQPRLAPLQGGCHVREGQERHHLCLQRLAALQRECTCVHPAPAERAEGLTLTRPQQGSAARNVRRQSVSAPPPLQARTVAGRPTPHRCAFWLCQGTSERSECSTKRIHAVAVSAARVVVGLGSSGLPPLETLGCRTRRCTRAWSCWPTRPSPTSSHTPLK